MVIFLTASCVLSSSHRLGMCVQLGNHRDLKDVTLQTVRILLLDDGANPCKSLGLWRGKGRRGKGRGGEGGKEIVHYGAFCIV